MRYTGTRAVSIWRPARAGSPGSRSINKLEQQLPSSSFVRSHQSYLVNMGYIQSVARYQPTLSNGLTLPISQSKYLNLQNSFILYVKQKKLWL